MPTAGGQPTEYRVARGFLVEMALKRYIQTRQKGIKADDLRNAVREEFKENEELPNTSHADDWAKITGKKGVR